MAVKQKSETVRVRSDTAASLRKVCGVEHYDCSVATFLRLVERGDIQALKAWQDCAGVSTTEQPILVKLVK